MSWTIALLGTNTLYLPDSLSEVSLASMDAAHDDPATDAAWKKFEVSGIHRIRGGFDGIKEATGGIAIHNKNQKRTFKIIFMPHLFPSETDISEALDSVFNYNHLYFFKYDYTFSTPTYKIHSDNKCLKVAGLITGEDEFPTGSKRYEATIQTIKPILEG